MNKLKKILQRIIFCHFGLVGAGLLSSNAAFGQGVEVVTSLNTSSNILFQNAKGIGINFQFKPLDSLIQFGVSFQNIINTNKYDVISDAFDAVRITYGFSQNTSKVQRTSFRFNSLIVLRNNKNIFLGVGPELSYNVLMGEGSTQYFMLDSNNTVVAGSSHAFIYNIVKAFGFGGLAKIEIKNIFTPRLSLCFNIRPEFIYKRQYTIDCDCGNDAPRLTGFNKFVEFQLGLKFNFNEKK